MKHILFFSILVGVSSKILASPPSTSKYICVDQFGYQPSSTNKMAVIRDPQTGFDAGESFSPGTAANQYQVKRWSDDVVVFTGTIQTWNGGATDTQSGDKAWRFDFSKVTTLGDYYIFDAKNNLGSYKFTIADNVYNEVLKAAVRMFYYQRSGIAKPAALAGANWADPNPSFLGTLQDQEARSITDPNNAITAKDLRGGWYDAGDVNKYISFAGGPVHQLLEAYLEKPSIWGDDYNIPESGNGVADVLDEVKWELDWMKRMQLSDGSVLPKMGMSWAFGATGTNSLPASGLKYKKFYVPNSCTGATIVFASAMAHAYVVYKDIPSMAAYANDCKQRAINAWNNYASIPTKQTNCDDQTICCGDADIDLNTQNEEEMVAAIYLFAATGDSKYKNIVDSRYKTLDDFVQSWSGGNTSAMNSLLFYASLPNATAASANDIKARKLWNGQNVGLYKFNNGRNISAYSFSDSWFQGWGSNIFKSGLGNVNMEMITYSIDLTNNAGYIAQAEDHLHYIHGVNPFNMVYLSNMYSYGAENSINEIYHDVFPSGSDWENAKTSKYGPPPGYLVGGPNINGSTTANPPLNQPFLKSYLDDNGFNKAYEYSEPGIYYQAEYVKLISKFVAAKVIAPIVFTIPSTIEAENAELSNSAAINNDHLNFSGTGFVDNFKNVGPRIVFRVNAVAAGDFDFKLFYANAIVNSSLSIYVNGVKIKQTALPVLANWDTWGGKTETLTLNKGVSTVEYVYDATDGGNVNLDKVEVTKSTVTGFETDNLFNLVNVYPNPFTSTIHISKKQAWQLYNWVGQLIGSGYSDMIDGESLESGLYVLKLDNNRVYKLAK